MLLRPLLLSCPFGFVAVASVTYAADESPCPSSVEVRQSAAPLAGWAMSNRKTANALAMVTFFSGPPAGEASLVYDEWVDTKAESIATWRFPRDPAGYWIMCSYSDTTVELSRALPASVTSCRVTYEPKAKGTAGLPAIKRIACR